MQNLEKQNLPAKNQTPVLEDTQNENTDTTVSDTTPAETIVKSEQIDIADDFLPDDITSEEVPTEKVSVSPYGFGPYPEIPKDFPLMEPRPFDWKGKDLEAELVMRVMIKAHTEGKIFGGAAVMIDGKVLLLYPNTAYFRYRETTTDDGSVVSTRVFATHPNIEVPDNLHPNVRVLHFDEAGIDPYEYLDLQ